MVPSKTLFLLIATFLILFVDSATYSTIADMLNSCCYDGALVSPTFTATSGAVEIITNPSIHNIIFAKNTATNVVVPIDVSCKTEPYAGKVYALDNGLTLELVSAVLMNGVALTDELDVAKFCNVLAREGTGTSSSSSTTSATTTAKGKRGLKSAKKAKNNDSTKTKTTTNSGLIFPLYDDVISSVLNSIEPDLSNPVYDCRRETGKKKSIWEWNETAFDINSFAPSFSKTFSEGGPVEGYIDGFRVNKTELYATRPNCENALQHTDLSCWASSGLSCCQSYTLSNNYGSWLGPRYKLVDADELETTFGNVLDKSLGYQKVFNEVVLDDWGHTSEGTGAAEVAQFLKYIEVINGIATCNPTPFNPAILWDHGEEASFVLPSCCDDYAMAEGATCTENEIADALALISLHSAVAEVWEKAHDYMLSTDRGTAVDDEYEDVYHYHSTTAGISTTTTQNPVIVVPATYEGYTSQNVLFMSSIFFEAQCSSFDDQSSVDDCLSLGINLSIDDVISTLEVNAIDISYIHGCSEFTNEAYANEVMTSDASSVEESFVGEKDSDYATCGIGNVSEDAGEDDIMLKHCFVYTPKGCTDTRLNYPQASCWNMAMLLDSAATIDNDGDISLSVVETVIDVLMDLVEAAQIAADAAAAADNFDVSTAPADGFGDPIRRNRRRLEESVEALTDFVDPKDVTYTTELYNQWGTYQVWCEMGDFNSTIECMDVTECLNNEVSEQIISDSDFDAFSTWILARFEEDHVPMLPKAFEELKAKINEGGDKGVEEIEKMFVEFGGKMPTSPPTIAPSAFPTLASPTQEPTMAEPTRAPQSEPTLESRSPSPPTAAPAIAGGGGAQEEERAGASAL